MSRIVKGKHVILNTEQISVDVESSADRHYVTYNKQRDTILEAAYQEAEKIKSDMIEQAEQEVIELKQKAYDESFSLGNAEGKSKGYAEGLSEGHDEGKLQGYDQGYAEAYEEVENKIHKTYEELKAMISEIEERKQQILINYEEGLTELSIKIAEKILKNKINTDKNTLVGIVKDVTRDYKNVDMIRISLHGEEEDIEMDTALTKVLAGASNDVRIQYKADLEEGSCIIETPDTIVDAGITTQINNLKEVMLTKTDN